MKEEIMLDGTSQFTLLALALAVVAYIRSIPYAQLRNKLDQFPANAPAESEECRQKKLELNEILLQTIMLDIVQILLALISVALLGRMILWADSLDRLILWTLFIIAVLLSVLHFVVNGKAIWAAHTRRRKPWK
jgi:hypothetical protein